MTSPFDALIRAYQALTQPDLVSPLPKQGGVSYVTGTNLAPIGHVSAATPAPTAPPSAPTPSAPADPNYRFAYETLPRDANYAANGPRPGFQPSQPPAQIGSVIRNIFPNEATKAALIASTENAQFDPNRADNVNAGQGGQDRGIFQINSNTFNGLMQRRGDELKNLGINSFEDMRDPTKNAHVAKMIMSEGGAGRWFGWQDTGYNLNNNWFSAPDRGAYAEALKRQR